MSLAGLVPPLTDKGDMLCDGGYVDNLPVGTLRGMGADLIFAADVGSVDDRIEMSYGLTKDLWSLTKQETLSQGFGQSSIVGIPSASTPTCQHLPRYRYEC